MSDTEIKERPAVELIGTDGNAFAVLGRCCRAGRAAGWDKDRIDAFMDEAMSGDYDRLLGVVMKHFDVT